MAPNIDGSWFKDELARVDSSVRKLAKHLHMDPSAVSRRFKGEHKISLEEAAEIARYIGQPLMTVIQKAGIPKSAMSPRNSGYVKITEVIDVDGNVYENPEKKGEFVQGPPDASDDLIAARIDTFSTPMEHTDGWVVFYLPQKGVSPDVIGKTCIVETKDEQFKLRIVKRARERGLYRVLGIDGADYGTESIISASPVLWIKTY